MCAKWILRFNHITGRLLGSCNFNSPKFGLRVSPDVTQTFSRAMLRKLRDCKMENCGRKLRNIYKYKIYISATAHQSSLF